MNRDDYSQYMEKKRMIQTTNQIIIACCRKGLVSSPSVHQPMGIWDIYSGVNHSNLLTCLKTIKGDDFPSSPTSPRLSGEQGLVVMKFTQMIIIIVHHYYHYEYQPLLPLFINKKWESEFGTSISPSSIPTIFLSAPRSCWQFL